MLDGMSDYSSIKDRKSPLKGSRPSVPHGTNFHLRGLLNESLSSNKISKSFICSVRASGLV